MDPVLQAEEISRLVSSGEARKYRRFRPARFYGGIATADCVDCNLRCLFCWSWNEVVLREQVGEFYTAGDVARRLVSIARKKGYDQVRISGNEPTLAREHLLGVLQRIPTDLLFILETNGILLGSDQSYAENLARFENLHVRVSFKGTTEEEFTRLTGAELQLQAVENLVRACVRMQPAAMVSFSTPENIRSLRRRLGAIAPHLRELEIEELALYGNVEERLRQAGIDYSSAHSPRRIPPKQV